ncbi:hypothetical protein TVAG_149420 [Trichomonas vaginalis G3]|uniref:Uncharacterized protein n=1 Tax=Trichomonas vaginalis (strain ATCC PRA-98 / G3) TaxID=412133 RepID=A2ELK9_TRIV3|nr:armadillo (ARM) repeat-containing protein family [Trichomonas vaginalis G3]EAY06456.1 hypothetical protein TVAG_149420 [Trichomonas vaginalis G3]KAI5548016.1 armadillo (ARM) repeat-containing protein family [Trichomonas vaginalis G3]|eukprot:XP_001318679.1 hypothetical protein [Trichomonas vaginalis G3]
MIPDKVDSKSQNLDVDVPLQTNYGRTVHSNTLVLVDTDEIDQAVDLLQNLETLQAGLNQLLDYSARQRIDLSNEVLQILLNILDPDFHAPEFIHKIDLKLINELISSDANQYITFYAGPNKIDVIFQMFPMIEAARCLASIMFRAKGVISRLVEIGLYDKINSLIKTHFEACCLVLTQIPNLYENADLFQYILTQLIQFLQSDDSNFVSDSIQTISQFCSQNKEATEFVLQSDKFVQLIKSDLDDLMISDIFTLFTKIVESTKSASILQSQIILEFLFNTVNETGCIVEVFDFISFCNRYQDFAESAMSEILINILFEVGKGNYSFKVKCSAIKALCTIIMSCNPDFIDYNVFIEIIEENIDSNDRQLAQVLMECTLYLAHSSNTEISSRILDSEAIREEFENISPDMVSSDMYELIQEFLNVE